MALLLTLPYRCAAPPPSLPNTRTHLLLPLPRQLLATELHEARRRFLVTVKASYWNQFKSGLLGRHAVRGGVACLCACLFVCGAGAARSER